MTYFPHRKRSCSGSNTADMRHGIPRPTVTPKRSGASWRIIRQESAARSLFSRWENLSTPVDGKSERTCHLVCLPYFQKPVIREGSRISFVVERSIPPLKVWWILSTFCSLFRNKTIRAINVIRRIIFYRPPPEPRFPANEQDYTSDICHKNFFDGLFFS